MAIQNYVLSRCISGITKDDIELDVNQMSENDSFLIISPKKIIAEDMYLMLSDILHPQYTTEMIRALLDIDGRYRLETINIGNDSILNSIIITVNNKSQTYYYDIKGQFICRHIYTVVQIEKENVGYLVTEHLLNPFKGCCLIERCYKPYFNDLFSAIRYRNNQRKQYTASHGDLRSGFKISVVDIREIEISEWYKSNLRVMDLIRQYNLNPEDYRYIPDISSVEKAILADAYDDLDVEQQAQVNLDIFHALHDYIDSEFLYFLDDDIKSAEDDEIEEITDNAIVLALVNAKTEKEFNDIHNILGPNEYRVGALTDEIYNNHPDTGYIVVSSDGDLGWYPSCYAINEWEKAKDNPFFGVFQPNENDTLYCFREFHPEVIATRLPKKADIQYWEDLYQKDCAEIRKLHPEIVFETDDEGDDVVFGTWYYEGLLSNKHIDDVGFLRTYGSHRFTEDECKQLLSGEEVVIEHFITKMDLEITIRGKLKDCASIFDEESQIMFTRTDINANKRKSLNADMGFEEPGLPPVNE